MIDGSSQPMKVCVVGASGKLGRYMVRHALDRGYEVVGVCLEQSVGKLVFSCGWHITRDGEDVYPRKLRWFTAVFGRVARLARFADLDDLIALPTSRHVWSSAGRGRELDKLARSESAGLVVVGQRRHGDLHEALFRIADPTPALQRSEASHDLPPDAALLAPNPLAQAAPVR